MPNVNEETLKKLVEMLAITRENEIGCEECFEHLDKFVDMYLSGEDPAEVMPLMQHHLAMCNCCHEDFLGLVHAIQSDSPES
jgi:hypothetical protein